MALVMNAASLDVSAAKQAIQSVTTRKSPTMFVTIAIIFILLWALGLMSSTMLGGYIHLLLVLAIVMVVINFLRGRRSL